MIKYGDYVLRPEYQEPAHIETLKWMHKNNYDGPAVIDASVGAGKTILIGAQAKYWTDKGANVMVLARQGELIEQDAEDAWSMGCKTSIFSASLKSYSTVFKCVMGTEQTVSNHLNTKFGEDGWVPHVLLIDECHHADITDIEAWIEAQKKSVGYECKTSYGKIITHFMKLRPTLRIIGYTGSPYRGKIDIINKFWEKTIYQISTMELVSMGYLVPPVFGFGDDDNHYDLSEFTPEGGAGANDFSSKELVAMQRKILKEQDRTEAIIEEVAQRTSDRNGVLITCAGKRHCEIVSQYLPDGTWGIITDDTSTKKRRKILHDAREGKIKYVLQVGCLTTGINIPIWDTCVILRRIGSLTLLVQLIGRVLRILKPKQVEQGIVKDDALVLDYTDTFEAMGDIYDNPIIDKALAQFQKDKNEPQKCPDCGEMNPPDAVFCSTDSCEYTFKQICPECDTVNSQYAVRCIGEDEKSDDGRCEHFFNCQMCLACNTENAPTAQSCRKCDAVLIDPNRNLVNKAYTDADYKPVKKVEFSETKSGDGLCVTYYLDSTYHDKGIEKPEVAKEYFKPFNKEPHNKQRWGKFIRDHINGHRFQQAMYRCRSVSDIIKNKAIFDIPVKITHRVNDKGFSIINRKEFRSGREVK